MSSATQPIGQRVRRVIRRRHGWLPWIAAAVCVLAILAVASYFERTSRADEPAPAVQSSGTPDSDRLITVPRGEFEYVALGDSYVSGPGIPEPLKDGVPGCDRSDAGWAELLADSLRTPVRNASCSGATTAHLSARQRTSTAAIYNPPQLKALGPQTALVTLQIGLNDLKLMSVISNCVGVAVAGADQSAPCRDRLAARGIDLGSQADALGDTVGDGLKAIAARAPEATLAVVGYPRIMPASGGDCWDAMQISAADMRYFDELVRRVNSALSAAAAAGDAAYVDTYEGSSGHDACRPRGERWIQPALPAYPDSGPYALHQNADGAEASAEAVAARIDR